MKSFHGFHQANDPRQIFRARAPFIFMSAAEKESGPDAAEI